MSKKKAFLFSLKHTYPMLLSWLPVALAYSLMMRNAGYNYLWTGFCSAAIPFGSLQMVAVQFFTSNVSWLVIVLTAAAIASRHLFYGISFLDRFRRFGAARYYLIYMLCDELYSLFCAYEIPADTDEKWTHLFTAMLLQCYWVCLTMSCSLLGSLIPFDLTGIDFALTALFTVILLDMLRAGTSALPAIAAGACCIVCLVLFGPESFLLPTLLLTTAVLTLLRGTMEKENRK